MNRMYSAFLALVVYGCAGPTGRVSSAPAPAGDGVYRAWVTSESTDEIALIRFGPEGAAVERTRLVGMMPVEIDAPHGVATSPNGEFVYITIGHGVPTGYLWKMDAETEEIIGRTALGLFPATVSVTPDGQYGFISNFNLHGDHVPSSISKVHLPTMAEVARTETCVMPHGSRVNPQGTRHYSVCMMDQVLVEIDVESGGVSRMFSVKPGMEGPAESHADHAATRDAAAGAAVAATDPAEICSPTWAEPSVDGSRVFVTCNRARAVLEIDVDSWRVVRRFETGEAPYNLAATPDGRHLLVTLRNRTDPALEIHDLDSGTRVARVSASTTLVHGVAVTSDSRYAFVSVEGIGSEPGKVDIVDLRTFERIASVEVGQQATGVAVVP